MTEVRCVVVDPGSGGSELIVRDSVMIGEVADMLGDDTLVLLRFTTRTERELNALPEWDGP